jgi:hypothetical protein
VVTQADADFGIVNDFLIDPDSWSIKYVEVGRSKTARFLLNPERIRNIEVTTREMRVASPRQ